MSAELIGVLGVIVLLVLMFSRIWIGAAMMLVGFFGYAFIDGWGKALTMIGIEPYTQTTNYSVCALALFVFMGTIVSVTGISGDLYRVASKWVGHIRGGLAIASVVACGGFAAMCGASVATAVTMGKVAFPEMKKYNYDDKLASSCIVAGGTLGVLIPPSMVFILYGILTEVSIGRLFIAGIIPGILEIVFYALTIYIICRFNPKMGPPGPRASLQEKVRELKDVWPMLFIFLLVIVGIYIGIVTPTEAGALGAVGAIAVALALKRLKWTNFSEASMETLENVSMILFLLIGAYIFMRFTNISNLPVMFGEFVVGLNISRTGIIALILLIYLIFGAFMDSISILILTLPIIFPTIVALGLNPIWWGVVMVRIMEIAMITPPVGINIFVLSKVINVPISTMYRGIWPFVVADICHVALLIAVPELSLFLVETMM